MPVKQQRSRFVETAWTNGRAHVQAAGTALRPPQVKDALLSNKPHVPGLTRLTGLAGRTRARERPISNDAARARTWR